MNYSERIAPAKGDFLALDELDQAFAVAVHVALDFGQCREVFALGLRDILSRDLRPSLCALDIIPE